MRIGVIKLSGTVDDVVEAARTARAQGFAHFWVPNTYETDALTVLAVAGREVPGIELGTAVVPTYPRHPLALAQQALTTQQACGGRLVLGIGLSHRIVVEGWFGMSYDRPIAHLRDYLAILLPFLRGEQVSYRGDTVSSPRGLLNVPGSPPAPPVLIAALGPQMLRLCGQQADGTITWCTGPKTLAEFTVPTLNAAAEAAGRPRPRVAAGLPVCVTGDVPRARERAAQQFGMYAQIPSYRAMLDREGVDGMADIAIVGGESEVRDRIGALAEVGVTDFVASEFGADRADRERTRALLASLVA